MAASPNNNRKNNSNILKTASLTGYAELDSKDPEAMKKRQKNIIIGGLSGIIIVFIACLLLIPMSPLSFFNPDSFWANLSKPQTVDAAELKKEEIKAAYAEHGIELNDEDLVVEVIENEDGTQTVDVKVSNGDKLEEMKKALQNDLDFITRANFGYSPDKRSDEDNNNMNNNRNDPNYNGDREWRDPSKDISNLDPDDDPGVYDKDEDDFAHPSYEEDDIQSELPTIEEVVASVNLTLRNTNNYIQASLYNDTFKYDYEDDTSIKADDDEGYLEDEEDTSGEDDIFDQDGVFEEDYVEVTKELIEQRQTGSPSDDSAFPFNVYNDQTMTYKEANKRLNGQTFINANMRDVFSTSNNPYLETFSIFNYGYYSDNLFANILNKGLYKNQFNPSSITKIEEYNGDEYILYTPSLDFDFTPSLKISTSSGYSLLMSVFNDKWVIVDII